MGFAGTLFAIAFRNLRQAGKRTFFLTLALGLVSMFLTVLLSLSHGILTTIEESATILQTGHVNVAGFFKVTSGRGVPVIRQEARLREIVEANVPELDFMIDRYRGFAKLYGPEGSQTIPLTGVDITQERRLRAVLPLAKESSYLEGGRDEVIGSLEGLEQPDSVMLFANQADRLGVKVGDVITVSAETGRGTYNTVDVTVVAVAKDIGLMSEFNVFLNEQAIKKLYTVADDTTSAIMLFLKDSSKAEEVMARLRNVLEDEGFELMDHLPQPFFTKFDLVNGQDWTGLRLDLTTWEDEVAMFLLIIETIDWMTTFLVSILMVIIAIGIVNAMYISVRERTSEIGTLRAIGMSRIRVLLMILLEGILMALLATSAGAAIGIGIAELVDFLKVRPPVEAFRTILLSETIRFEVDFAEVAHSILSFTFVTALAALPPAIQAARLQPVTAIQRR